MERFLVAAACLALVVLGFVSALVPAVDVAVSAALLALAAVGLVLGAGPALAAALADRRDDAGREQRGRFAEHCRYVAGLHARGTADDPDPTTPLPRELLATTDTAAPAGREHDTDTRKAA